MKLGFVYILMLTNLCFSQSQPSQPASGPGSATYSHATVNNYDFDPLLSADGYWLYEPSSPKPDSANVIVFNHGYGVYNPGPYGKWIEHLVRQGNIVIFPRYQLNLSIPLPSVFTNNAAKAIRDALTELQSDTSYVQPRTDNFALIGHSFGGVISSNLATEYAVNGIPKPKALMPCAPGTGGFNSGRLTSYIALDTSISTLIVVAENDIVVGDTFGRELFNTTAIPFSRKNLVIQKRHLRGLDPVLAGHNECLAADFSYDGGTVGSVITGGYTEGATDAVNYYCYWKLADALINCAFNGNDCNVAFGDTYEQKFMGKWSDSTDVNWLEVYPKNPTSITESEGLKTVNIFPNPTQGNITIEHDLKYNSVEIYSLSGELTEKINISTNELNIQEHVKSGKYYLHFKHNDKIVGVAKVTLVNN